MITVAYALMISHLALGQIPVEISPPHHPPGSAQRHHPMFVDAPAFFIVELDEEETRRHYVMMYLNELAERKVTSQTIHWPEGDSDVPVDEAVQFWNLYSGLMSDIGAYVWEWAAHMCAIDSNSPVALRGWAQSRNARDVNLLMFYDRVIDDVETRISMNLARRLEWGITAFRNSQTEPVEKWVVDVEAGDEALLQAYRRACPAPIERKN